MVSRFIFLAIVVFPGPAKQSTQVRTRKYVPFFLSQADRKVPEEHSRLQEIVTIYAYAAAELGRPPRSIDDLRPIFEQASIEHPNEMLTSTRDGRPYVIVWGIDLAGRYAGADVPVAYESEGVDSTRLLVTCRQQVREVSSEEFADLNWSQGYQPKL